ncbi:TetR/AcrR family transcriptional regulator [Mucilaginibacter sp. OK283]|jgi:AcrR family transcriptional regulator|uniref:TetR/AcrR family transcriptional regulator n=1 Tax=Mucilaginibacter sp. OK283 TaxID=1881049 RepID=UPI0008CD2335|nr:TetR/AcrR family transcriptional regulator [Mucilaginibacter sp. OK283]SEP43395.1 transcriptional regulator, TetR family [Mucilaginibacter sp. OK283]
MDTSKKIANKVHNLFSRYGIRSISMDDIASDLRISKKTIYQFYSNKDSLVETFVDRAIDENIFRCKTLIAKSDDAIIGLYFLLVYAMELYNILNPAIVYDLEKNHELAYEKLKGHKTMFIHQTIKACIERGVKSGLYRNDFDIDVITRFFLESLAIVSGSGIFPQVNHKIKPTDEVFACLLSGIATLTGLEVVNAYKNQRGIMVLNNDEDRPFWDH